jgi:hypothetical protein
LSVTVFYSKIIDFSVLDISFSENYEIDDLNWESAFGAQKIMSGWKVFSSFTASQSKRII